jgi:hypothetical protein
MSSFKLKNSFENKNSKFDDKPKKMLKLNNKFKPKNSK